MKKYLFFLCFILLLFSCSEDEKAEYLGDPDYPVYIEISQKEMGNIGEAIFNNNNGYPLCGIGGIGLIKFAYTDPAGTIEVFDLACPHDWYMDNLLIIMKLFPYKEIYCSHCKSEYNVITGKSIYGPAYDRKFNLIKYRVTHRKDGSYLISN
jgi:nitrite reductase/ring-hydroxylating ferredoxin subunit